MAEPERILFVLARPGDEAALIPATTVALAERGASADVLICGGDEMVADIATAIRVATPDLVVSHRDDGDAPDRARVGLAARDAADLLALPFWVIDEPGDRTGTVRVGSSNDVTRQESFTRIVDAPPAAPAPSVLSRIGSAVAVTVLGAFAGTLLTAAHQASISVRDVTVPWGIIAGLLITSALFAGLRIVFETRLLAGCAAFGLLASIAFLAIQSPGGSVLVPANAVGFAWTFGPVIIATVVLAWPRFSRQGQR